MFGVLYNSLQLQDVVAMFLAYQYSIPLLLRVSSDGTLVFADLSNKILEEADQYWLRPFVTKEFWRHRIRLPMEGEQSMLVWLPKARLIAGVEEARGQSFFNLGGGPVKLGAYLRDAWTADAQFQNVKRKVRSGLREQVDAILSRYAAQFAKEAFIREYVRLNPALAGDSTRPRVLRVSSLQRSSLGDPLLRRSALSRPEPLVRFKCFFEQYMGVKRGYGECGLLCGVRAESGRTGPFTWFVEAGQMAAFRQTGAKTLTVCTDGFWRVGLVFKSR